MPSDSADNSRLVSSVFAWWCANQWESCCSNFWNKTRVACSGATAKRITAGNTRCHTKSRDEADELPLLLARPAEALVAEVPTYRSAKTTP